MPASANKGGQNPEFVLREFQGMNLLAEREAINDEEFAWCENAIPVASAALYPVNGPTAALATIGGEAGPPSYVQSFNEAGVDYCFAVWANSGNGWIVNLSSFATTKIITGLSSNQTAAIQYSNQGLLIIDPFSGYFDWNITTPNVLTSQNNSAANATLTGVAKTIAGGTSLKQIVTGAGTGATFQAVYSVVYVFFLAPGTGYAVGDTIYLTDGAPTMPATLVVATIGAGGAVSSATLSTGGAYPGPPTSALVATGPTGTVTSTTGAGTGATFTVNMRAVSMNILTRGSGYTGTTTVVDETAAPVVLDTWNITSSGVIGGTSIATYAGRVWIGLLRTVYFTDINSYSSFGGVGGSFLIADAYLHNKITALFAANNYLYIFGDTSIDALSNVTVSLGVTSFSRINVTVSVGTTTPTSIFGYYRSIVFYHSSGFYSLAGATPEKMSEKISAIIQQIVQAQVGGNNIPFVYGGQALVRGELCATLLFSFKDTFTQGGTTRTVFALFFRGRWWVASLPSLASQGMVSIPAAGNATLYVWSSNAIYQAFSASAALAPWLLKTKLWDAGAPLTGKQSLNAAIGANWAGASTSGVTLTVDTELGSSSALPVPLNGSPVGYQLNPQSANEGGSQYLGLTVAGSTNVTQIRLLALKAKAERDIMQ